MDLDGGGSVMSLANHLAKQFPSLFRTGPTVAQVTELLTGRNGPVAGAYPGVAGPLMAPPRTAAVPFETTEILPLMDMSERDAKLKAARAIPAASAGTGPDHRRNEEGENGPANAGQGNFLEDMELEGAASSQAELRDQQMFSLALQQHLLLSTIVENPRLAPMLSPTPSRPSSKAQSLHNSLHVSAGMHGSWGLNLNNPAFDLPGPLEQPAGAALFGSPPSHPIRFPVAMTHGQDATHYGQSLGATVKRTRSVRDAGAAQLFADEPKEAPTSKSAAEAAVAAALIEKELAYESHAGDNGGVGRSAMHQRRYRARRKLKLAQMVADFEDLTSKVAAYGEAEAEHLALTFSSMIVDATGVIRTGLSGGTVLSAEELSKEADMTCLCREWLGELEAAKVNIERVLNSVPEGSPVLETVDFRDLMRAMIVLTRRQATQATPLPLSTFLFSDPSGLDRTKGYGFAWPHLLLSVTSLRPALGPRQIQHILLLRDFSLNWLSTIYQERSLCASLLRRVLAVQDAFTTAWIDERESASTRESDQRQPSDDRQRALPPWRGGYLEAIDIEVMVRLFLESVKEEVADCGAQLAISVFASALSPLQFAQLATSVSPHVTNIWSVVNSIAGAAVLMDLFFCHVPDDGHRRSASDRIAELLGPGHRSRKEAAILQARRKDPVDQLQLWLLRSRSAFQSLP